MDSGIFGAGGKRVKSRNKTVPLGEGIEDNSVERGRGQSGSKEGWGEQEAALCGPDIHSAAHKRAWEAGHLGGAMGLLKHSERGGDGGGHRCRRRSDQAWRQRRGEQSITSSCCHPMGRRSMEPGGTRVRMRPST